MYPKSKINLIIIISLVLAVMILGAIIFNGCNKEPKIEHIDRTIIDHRVEDSLKQEIQVLAAQNLVLESRAIESDAKVEKGKAIIKDLGQKYKSAREKKDTGLAFGLCDTLVKENDLLASYIDSAQLAHQLQVGGLKTQINVQAVAIDTLTANNKTLEWANDIAVARANANADAANKANKKLKGTKFLTRVLAGTIVVLGVILATK